MPMVCLDLSGRYDWSSALVLKRADLKIREERLEEAFEVRYFKVPPTPDEDNLKDFWQKSWLDTGPFTLKRVTFPEWLECPYCHRLGKRGSLF